MYSSSFHIGKKIDSFLNAVTKAQGTGGLPA